MSGPYGRAMCGACDQYVEWLCEEHEEFCADCCADLEHEEEDNG